MVCQLRKTVISSISRLFSVTVSARCGTSWSVVYDACVKYGAARKCQREFESKFTNNSNLVNKLRTVLLIHEKQKHKNLVLTGNWPICLSHLNPYDIIF
jgi:hypothetical protein